MSCNLEQFEAEDDDEARFQDQIAAPLVGLEAEMEHPVADISNPPAEPQSPSYPREAR